MTKASLARDLAILCCNDDESTSSQRGRSERTTMGPLSSLKAQIVFSNVATTEGVTSAAARASTKDQNTAGQLPARRGRCRATRKRSDGSGAPAKAATAAAGVRSPDARYERFASP